MKETKRYISAAVGLVLLAAVIYLVDTIVLNVILAFIGIVAVYESVKACCKAAVLWYIVPCSLFVVTYIFFSPDIVMTTVLLIFILFCISMGSGGRYTYKEMSKVFLLTVLIAFGLSSVIALRDFGSTVSDKRVLVIFGFGYGWLGDSLAYTFGKAFGKRKMSPRISPGKTIFGAVSAITITTIASALLFFLYASKCAPDSLFYNRNTLGYCVAAAAAGLVGSIIGVLGDLALSFVKRDSGIKDFGKIMPGHGGAIDRIDNILFTSVYACFVFSLLLR